MTGVPSDYHDFTDVFSKTRACTLALHWPYDLKIELEEGTSPPFSLIYSLSQSELKSLQEFLDEHLAMDFICSSQSPGRALVLFAHKKDSYKKDSSLQLCINFHGLNKITKKDQYPLPRITVRVPIFPIVVCVRSAYVIGAGVGFRVESGAVALLQLYL